MPGLALREGRGTGPQADRGALEPAEPPLLPPRPLSLSGPRRSSCRSSRMQRRSAERRSVEEVAGGGGGWEGGAAGERPRLWGRGGR